MGGMSSRSWKHPDWVVYEDEPAPREEPLEFLNMANLYPEWHLRASCNDTSDSLFFGSNEPDMRPPYTLGEIKRARSLCADCPVFRDCLRSSLENREAFGVWAGSTSKQRRKMLGRIDAGESTINDEVEHHVVLMGTKLHVVLAEDLTDD